MFDYNTENPMVRDELWDDDYEDEKATYVEFDIDFGNLEGDDRENFLEELVIVSLFDCRPKAVFTGDRLVTVKGEMFQDEISELKGLLDDYRVDYEFYEE